jgi:hypothetical protein
MLHLTYESIYQYDLSSLGGYQFANPGISLLYILHYNQYFKHIVVNYLL